MCYWHMLCYLSLIKEHTRVKIGKQSCASKLMSQPGFVFLPEQDLSPLKVRIRIRMQRCLQNWFSTGTRVIRRTLSYCVLEWYYTDPFQGLVIKPMMTTVLFSQKSNLNCVDEDHMFILFVLNLIICTIYIPGHLYICKDNIAYLKKV